jgi:DNA-binding CsgD family transcriptional regulator
MDADRLARLTEKQRQCLRMVYLHMQSKEIAPVLGIEPGSVDQHIKDAMRILGVGSRRSAALILAEHEGLGATQPLVHQPLGIAAPAAPETMASSTEDERQQSGDDLVGAMREEQSAYEAVPTLRPGKFTLPLPIRGGRPSDLTPLQRLGWIIAIILVIALTFGVFVAGLEALSRLGPAVGF